MTEQLQELPEKEAELKIREFIQERKKKGAKEINILEFMIKLHLPGDQIDRIMTKLVKEGVVGESD